MHRYLPYQLLKNSPSHFSGIPSEREKEIKLIGIHFLRKLGHGLGFPYYTIATATDAAITCILVASKVEETYKKIKQILITACKILNPNFQGFDVDTEEFENHRLKVASYERLLLDSITYDFHCSHPHLIFLKRLKQIYDNKDISKILVHKGINILDEFYCTSLCIQYPPSHLSTVALLFCIYHSELSPEEHINEKDFIEMIIKGKEHRQSAEYQSIQSLIKKYNIDMKDIEDIWEQWREVQKLMNNRSLFEASDPVLNITKK